jgi:hypothetical protein
LGLGDSEARRYEKIAESSKFANPVVRPLGDLHFRNAPYMLSVEVGQNETSKLGHTTMRKHEGLTPQL